MLSWAARQPDRRLRAAAWRLKAADGRADQPVLDATLAARIRVARHLVTRWPGRGRWVNAGYWRERRGPSLIQSRMPTASSRSQGENRMCAAKPRMARATMAMTVRAMIASMAIGLHSCRSGGAHVQAAAAGCPRR